MTLPRGPDPSPLYFPVDVAHAVFAMWASLVVSVAFAIYEFLASSSILDPLLRLCFLSGYALTVLAMPHKKDWARYAAVVLTVLFYAALALDADGLTVTDLLHLIARFPLDAFVIAQLFKPSVSKWLLKS